MQNNQFKTPLLQSAAIVAAVVILVISLGSTGAEGDGGGILGVFAGIGNTILFVIGMAVSVCISIAILVGIFLAAVAMVDKDQASQMFNDLKKKFSQSLLTLNGACCAEKSSGPDITEEEYELMKQSIAALQDNNIALQGEVRGLAGEKETIQNALETVLTDNASLKEKIEELYAKVGSLQDSEIKIKELVDELSSKLEASSANNELLDQLQKLESTQADTRKEIETLISKVNGMEATATEKSQEVESSGVFSYIEKEDQQLLFKEKVEEGVILEMTYAQMDEHLTENLPTDLYKVVKDHPTLTKNYIREIREANN
jgi:chromosome segregation ATPase